MKTQSELKTFAIASSHEELQAFLFGLEMITRYQPNAEIAIDSESIYIGDYVPGQMTEEEEKQMDRAGWDGEEGWWIFYIGS